MSRRRDYPVAVGVSPPPLHVGDRPNRFLHIGLIGTATTITAMLIGWFIFQGPGADFMRGFDVQLPSEFHESVAVAEKTPAPTAKANRIVKPQPVIETKPEPVPVEPPKPIKPVVVAAVTFEKQVLPIFAVKCFSCHGGEKMKGELDLRTLADVKKGGESGPSIVAGDLGKSLLWESVEVDRMPPGKIKLSTGEKDLLRKWIESGAK